MSASIRINIMGGSSIADAYENCAALSERLGGISIETTFNGVEMFYHRQTMAQWFEDYYTRIHGKSHKEEGAE